MRWTRFQVEGVKHVGNLDIPGCTVLNIKGPNGAGKTLLLKLFTRMFEKKHDPELIADGHEEAVMRLELEDGPTKMVITRRQTRKEAPAKIEYADGRVVDTRIETTLKEIAAGFSLDPLRLLSADKHEREKFLREVMPITLTGAEVMAATGMTGISSGPMDLETFDAHLAGAETRRTSLNSDKTSLEGMLKATAESVLEDPDGIDYWNEAQRLDTDLNALLSDRKTDLSGVLNTHGLAVAERKTTLERDIAKLRTAAEGEITELVRQRDADSKRIEEEYAPRVASATEIVGAARAKAEQQKKQQGLREEVDRQKKRLNATARAATEAQIVVDKLREHRQKKLSVLPIEGIEYHGGKIFVDGLDLDTQCNTFKQYQTAVLICGQGVKQNGLPFMVTDRIESMDAKNRQWFFDAIKDAGWQCAVTEVVQEAKQLEIEAAVA